MLQELVLAFPWDAFCSLYRGRCRNCEHRQHSLIISSRQGLTLASRRQGRLLPLMWGWEGGWSSSEAADKIVKALLIPHYPPLSCSSGRGHVVSNNCHIPPVRWPPRGPLIWLLQGSSIPKMLQVPGKWGLSLLLPL